MLSDNLLNILACPACKGELLASQDRSSVDCPACSLCFEVREGIPVMLLDEAQKLPCDEGVLPG